MKFIDPRIDFAFKKIFGSEDAKDILISFLESLLGLTGERCLAEVTILDPFLAPRLKELKSTVLDVRCQDRRGISYIVEMQVEKVPAFLKRVQYNSAKAYVQQIGRGVGYNELKPVIAITITDYVIFSGFDHCVSVHESRETITGQSHLVDILHYFVELPKFAQELEACNEIVEQWIYFIKYAGSIEEIPPEMRLDPIRHAFEKARLANMTPDELELYDKAGIALADARGRVEQAREEGEKTGEKKGERKGEAKLLLRLLKRRFGELPAWVQEKLQGAEPEALEQWGDRVLEVHSLEEIFTPTCSA